MSNTVEKPRAPRSRRANKRPVLAMLSLGVGALLMVASGAGLVVVRLASHAVANVPQENLLGSQRRTAANERHADIGGAKTLLLVGIDSRPGENEAEGVRADSIIIAHIAERHDAVYLVSIPRDTLIQIPASDNGAHRFSAGEAKINEAYARGGMGLNGAKARAESTRLLAKTIKQAYGIDFDGAAIVDFDGFRAVIEALGGVDMYVDEETTSIHIGYDRKGKFATPYRPRYQGSDELVTVPGVTANVYRVGQQHLGAHEALDFARQRKLLDNGDYDRQRHQQQLIKAVMKQVVSQSTLTDPRKLLAVIEAIGKAMTIDSGGIAVEDWAYAMRGLRGEDILTIKTNNGTYNPAVDDRNSEALDANTVALLRSIADRTVGSFVASHPELVNQA